VVTALCEAAPAVVEWLADTGYPIEIGADMPRAGMSVPRLHTDVGRLGGARLVRTVPVLTGLALVVAILLFETRRRLVAYRAILFLPYILLIPLRPPLEVLRQRPIGAPQPLGLSLQMPTTPVAPMVSRGVRAPSAD
jgi:hypothetical protein